MRLLAQGTQLLSLDKVGMPAPMVRQLRQTLKRTSGMVLATGPTGSGKTTTLYSILSELNTPERKLITVEDPVEYRLPGVNQVQVNEKIGLGFSAVLRSILRQDPDVVLVGEMRDHDTAETGLRAAMTGHMVLSSLHTNDAATTPARLVNMGAPAYMVGLALQNVVAQRLLRVVCTSCGTTQSPDAADGAYLQSVLGAGATAGNFKRGPGCPDCNNTGYSGRVGIYEMLTMDGTLIRELGRSDITRFAEAARAQMGKNTLQNAALTLALEGRTTLAEAMKLAVNEVTSP
jgi:MSHA biogenesis protein MshE